MMACVAKGGESCLTSGDRRKPEDKYVYIKTSSPSLGKAERGGRGKMWWRDAIPRVPFSHPRLSIIRRLRRRLSTAH